MSSDKNIKKRQKEFFSFLFFFSPACPFKEQHIFMVQCGVLFFLTNLHCCDINGVWEENSFCKTVILYYQVFGENALSRGYVCFFTFTWKMLYVLYFWKSAFLSSSKNNDRWSITGLFLVVYQCFTMSHVYTCYLLLPLYERGEKWLWLLRWDENWTLSSRTPKVTAEWKMHPNWQ